MNSLMLQVQQALAQAQSRQACPSFALQKQNSISNSQVVFHQFPFQHVAI